MTHLYGPVKIGGPCRKCGVANFLHAGKTCEEALTAQQERLRKAFEAIRVKLSQSIAQTESVEEFVYYGA